MTLERLLILALFLLACAPDRVGLDGSFEFPDAPALEASVEALEAAVDVPPELATLPDRPTAPDAGPRTTFPPLRVFVAPTWTASQRNGIWSGIGLLSPLVPHVVETSLDAADLGIYPAESQDCSVVAGDVYVRTAYADPRCFPTASGFDFPHAIAHLVLHHLGLRHVCVGPGESATDCSRVPFGRGIMNVHFAEERTIARTRLGWAEGLSAFDRAEAQRVLSTETWRFP